MVRVSATNAGWRVERDERQIPPRCQSPGRAPPPQARGPGRPGPAGAAARGGSHRAAAAGARSFRAACGPKPVGLEAALMSTAGITDLYEVTMALSYLREGVTASATFSLNTRSLPPDRGFLVSAGLEPASDYPEAFHVDEEDIAAFAHALHPLRRTSPLCGASAPRSAVGPHVAGPPPHGRRKALCPGLISATRHPVRLRTVTASRCTAAARPRVGHACGGRGSESWTRAAPRASRCARGCRRRGSGRAGHVR